MKFSTLVSIFTALSGVSSTASAFHIPSPPDVDFYPNQHQLEFHGVSDKVKEPTLAQLWGEDWPFTGIPTFAHLNQSKCLLHPELDYDIGIIGVPFDTATTYRSGARFGPRAIRAASQRQTTLRGFNTRAGINPYQNWATFLDCGDIPVTPMDNELALEQMTKAFEELILKRNSSQDPSKPPRYIALGGDHSVLLPHVRALRKKYGKIAVIHFDAHLDTWAPSKYPSFWSSDQSKFTHGSMLWMAREEKLISDDYNVHVGLRTRISGTDWDDYNEDTEQGWIQVSADDVWVNGVAGLQDILDRIHSRIPSDYPVYLSVDIDCLDPGFAPGTGTIEPGGLLPRELIYLLRHLDVNLVGADIVEVSPQYDNSEITATNAAQVVYEMITSMVQKGVGLSTIDEE
ncbi:hypothetical protein CANARDRAFT_144629 [[Candida] arabinofermentans NRRL YB-2248]|uniref:Agmatinase n=1 Tax=[Candida] arabinofermentans NRRL YB-2248 TaxID=983967 RepID=A0A1E4T283_9ASCO|nr:hypothetical protein CANARDRAFT_144629 [[Candida] arabinofermentans NRRL YB-2248]